jgi:hypothetical protein
MLNLAYISPKIKMVLHPGFEPGLQNENKIEIITRKNG